MRILYLCHLSPSTCDYPLFLAQAWERAGHAVQLFPVDVEYVERLSAQLANTLLGWHQPLLARYRESRVGQACASFRPDILLVGGEFLTPAAVRRLRRRYSCRLGFLLSYLHLMEGDTVPLMREMDLVIVHDSYMIPILRGTSRGKVKHVLHMPCMAEPSEHLPLDLSAEDRQRYGAEITFIGGWDPNRASLLTQLRDRRLALWGYGWDRTPELKPFFRDEAVYGLKKTKIYNAADIVLNIQDPEKQVNSISNRVPEALACGGFVLTDWHADLERLPLKEDESIVCYRTPGELQEKARYYLEHPEERRRISERGRKLVLEQMTYSVVAARLAKEMGQVLPPARA